MMKQYWIFMITVLTFFSGNVKCQSFSGVSWIYAGTAQQNNTVLTFNLYDTLTLICRGNGYLVYGGLIFALSKGTSTPTTFTLPTSGALTIANIGSLIWSDIDGIQSGYENFIIYGNTYTYSIAQSLLSNDRRYINIGTLKTSDSGTYICAAAFIQSPSATPTTCKTSGSLTIIVNTKASQAKTSRNGVNRLFTYSAALLGAAKLVF